MTSTSNTELITMIASDGEAVEGALYTPKKGFPKDKPAVVLVHGALGNYYTGVPRELAPRLAKKGYAALAINTRYHDYFEMDMMFEDEANDIGAAVKQLSKMGAKRIVLLGHSRGVPRVLFYFSKTKDPKVKGLILLGGPASSSGRFREMWGVETTEKFVQIAKSKITEGDPLFPISLTGKGTSIRAGFEWYHPTRPAIAARLALTARALVERMERADLDAIVRIKDATIPILIVHGAKDGIVDPKDADRLKDASPSPRIETVYIDSGHYFKGHEEELTKAVTGWLRRL